MTTTAAILLPGIPHLFIFTASIPEIPVAATALERKPASVTINWIADKNAVDPSIRRSIRAAFLFPCSFNLWILFLFTEATAISAPAKYPLIRVSTRRIRSCVKILADCGSVSIIKNSSFWMYAFSQIIIRMIII